MRHYIPLGTSRSPCSPATGSEAPRGKWSGPGPPSLSTEPRRALPSWAFLCPGAWHPPCGHHRCVSEASGGPWMIIYRSEVEIRLLPMPVYVPFEGYKEMAPVGAMLLCQRPPPPTTVSFCLSFIAHSYLSSSPSPTLVQSPRP